MKLIKSKFASENYLSKIVRIDTFRKHSDPEVTRLKCATIDGFNIITGIDAEPGLYVYFPALSQINADFLAFNNLFRDKGLNVNPEKSGMFEANCKVKPIKLRGELSEGFIMPIKDLQDYITEVCHTNLGEVEEGLEFDSVSHSGKEFWLSRKYTVAVKRVGIKEGKPSKKVPKRINKVREDQFRFHYNTIVLKKEPDVIHPNSLIEISYKIHGTSAIFANVLCHKELTWKEKIAKWLTGHSFDQYDNLYASRKVIKNQYYNKEAANGGYYNVDVWGYANKIVAPLLKKGQTVYAEIVGYLPDGGFIQKNYDYGCVPPVHGLYKNEENFKIRVYRVTETNVDGNVLEYTPLQVQQWCARVGLTPVEECYVGYAKDLYPDLDVNDPEWSEHFLEKISNDKNFYMELDSPDCRNKVPHEGVVIKPLDKLGTAFKVKSFKFISRVDSLDEANIEDQ